MNNSVVTLVGISYSLSLAYNITITFFCVRARKAIKSNKYYIMGLAGIITIIKDLRGTKVVLAIIAPFNSPFDAYRNIINTA